MPKMKWKDFVGRRRLDVSQWVKNKDILSVKEFQSACDELDVESPSEDEIKTFLPQLQQVGSKLKVVLSSPSEHLEPTEVEIIKGQELKVETVESFEEMVEKFGEESIDKPKRGRKKKTDLPVDSEE